MPNLHAQPSRAQSLAGALVLLALLVVAGGVILEQFRFDPAQWGRVHSGPQQPAGPLVLLKVPGLTALGAGQSFTPATLSDKINGKADLYLAAGFKGLFTRRYALEGKPQAWLEMLLFVMNSPQAAYSVFSTQRRTGAVTSDLADQAYTTKNAVYLVNGADYLEVVASSAAPELKRAARAAAWAYLKANPVEQPQGTDDTALLPAKGRQEDSLMLLAKDAFGMAGLDQVQVAIYPVGQEEPMAFVSRRADAAQAQAKAEAYAKFLLANGAQETKPSGLEGARLFNIMDTWEVVFSQGPFLAGVRGAEDRAATLDLARRLKTRIQEAQP